MRWYQHRYHSPLSFRIVFATIPYLPRAVHPPIAWVTAAIFFVILRKERRAVLRNLKMIRGGTSLGSWWTAYRIFYSFCDLIVSYCYLPCASHADLLEMLTDPDRGAHAIDACLSAGRGLVAWTAHVGNWEVASRLLELHGRRVAVARVVERDNPAERMLRDLMTNERLRVVDLNDQAASIQLLHALRENEIVAMQGDRVTGWHRMTLPFCGRPTEFPEGPFRLAYAADSPVVPCVALRTGWLRYRLIVGETIHLNRNKSADDAVREGLARAVDFLSSHVSEWQCQWLNFFDLWPAGLSSVGADDSCEDRLPSRESA